MSSLERATGEIFLSTRYLKFLRQSVSGAVQYLHSAHSKKVQLRPNIKGIIYSYATTVSHILRNIIKRVHGIVFEAGLEEALCMRIDKQEARKLSTALLLPSRWNFLHKVIERPRKLPKI
jgi:hypothetical protein